MAGVIKIMDKYNLRKLVLKALGEVNVGSYDHLCIQIGTIAKKMGSYLVEEGQSPSGNIYYHRGDEISYANELLINEIFWDLISERVITVGSNLSNLNYPNYRITDFGRDYISEPIFSILDNDGYLGQIKAISPNIDNVILQYASEGFNCFKQKLVFASAVMFGAASERLSFLLLESLLLSETQERRISEGKKLSERGNLRILEHLNSRISFLISEEKIPFNVHEGTLNYLSSLMEMIRLQRNSAVHTRENMVTPSKVLLT